MEETRNVLGEKINEAVIDALKETIGADVTQIDSVIDSGTVRMNLTMSLPKGNHTKEISKLQDEIDKLQEELKSRIQSLKQYKIRLKIN